VNEPPPGLPLQRGWEGQRAMLVTLTGPTGVGKSGLALRLAAALGGEIVNADSRTVYRGLDVGTAKPSPAELAAVPHHLIDVVNPDESYSLSLYQQQAYSIIDDCLRRGRLPLLVGGTLQYVSAVVEGWTIPTTPPDAALRARLAASDPAALYAELQQVDPSSAAKIDERNQRRVIRALEVWHSSGQQFSSQQRKVAPAYRQLRLALTCERRELYRRIDARVDAMIDGGLVAEVQGLAARYGLHLPALSAIGYRQVGAYLRGESTLTQASQQIKFDTHAFVRHQYAWFRRDQELRWIDNTTADPYDAALAIIREFIT